MALLLDGKVIAEQILEDLKIILSKEKKRPSLAIIKANNDPASAKFVELKISKAEELGINTELIEFDELSPLEALLEEVKNLNENKEVTGILVQLPLFDHLPVSTILNHISPDKDVDGLSAFSLGQLLQGQSRYLPAVVRAVGELLDAYEIPIEKQDITIVGASAWVGMPLAIYLEQRGGTVTLCHDKTTDLTKKTKQADILISATGVPGLITEEFVKKKAVVIDIGSGKNCETGKIEGDVSFEKVSRKANFISPVPGGVGPLTIACLLSQVVLAFSEKHKVL